MKIIRLIVISLSVALAFCATAFAQEHAVVALNRPIGEIGASS